MLVLLLSVVGAPRVVQAQSARIVLVRAADSEHRGLARLRAELDALGLEVVEVELEPGNTSPGSLDDTARRLGAFAAVRLVPSVDGAEVWVADRITGKTVLREVVVAQNQPADEVVALRAVELLRASLLELRLPKAQPQNRVPPRVQRLVPVAAPEPEPAPPHKTLELTLGPAVSTSPGGLSPALQGFLGVRYHLPELVSFEVFAMLPTFPTSLSSEQGDADVSIGMAGAGLQLRLTDRSIRTRLGAGGAAVLLRMDGSPSAEYLGRTETVVTGAPFVSFGVARELGSTLAIGAEVIGGVAIPRPVIDFAGGRVATWGRPFACAALTLDFRLP